MLNPIYNLPSLDFVGGESKQLVFELSRPSGGPFNADGCTVELSIIGYTNKIGEPIVVVDGSLSLDESGYYSCVIANIPAQETVDLFGKYVYQLSIKDSYGLVDIPGQGFMNITRNIHRNFVTGITN